MTAAEWGFSTGLLSVRPSAPADTAYLEKRRTIVRESMRRQRERKGVSAGDTTGIRRQAFPEGTLGLRLFKRALRFYWVARGHVRKPKAR